MRAQSASSDVFSTKVNDLERRNEGMDINIARIVPVTEGWVIPLRDR